MGPDAPAAIDFWARRTSPRDWTGRAADYPLLRSNGGGTAVLSAFGWRLTSASALSTLPLNVACQAEPAGSRSRSFARRRR